MCVVQAETFFSNPKEYLARAKNEVVTIVTNDGSLFLQSKEALSNMVVISRQEFERLETEAGIAEGEADFVAGRILTHEQMLAVMDAKIAEARERL